MRRLSALLAVLLPVVAGCATLTLQRQFETLPLLPPAAFGAEAARSQRLTVTGADGTDGIILDAAVEVGADEVRMAGFLLGQRVFLLSWDGGRLEEAKAPMVPDMLRAHAVLRDLQLVYWPADDIRQVLPRGWHLEEGPDGRRLLRGARVLFESQRSDNTPLGGASIRNHIGRYAITIESEDESR